MSSYKDYLLGKYNYDGAIEDGGSFLLYKAYEHELSIGELYVPKEERRSGVGSRLADQAAALASDRGLRYLTCQTELTGKDDALSMQAILGYGFIPFAVEGANNEHKGRIKFFKELPGGNK